MLYPVCRDHVPESPSFHMPGVGTFKRRPVGAWTDCGWVVSEYAWGVEDPDGICVRPDTAICPDNEVAAVIDRLRNLRGAPCDPVVVKAPEVS